MLEQPPERSALEIEAAAAAAAQISPRRRSYGCLRLLIWCMPTFFFYSIALAFIYITQMLFHSSIDILKITFFFVLIIFSTFGLGYFEGHCFPDVIADSPVKRLRYNLSHAAVFTALQFLFIPVLSFIFLLFYILLSYVCKILFY